MNCVIVTLGYPYKQSEPYLENELRRIEKLYDKITILPLTKPEGEMRYVPENAEICSIKRKQVNRLSLLKLITDFNAVREFVYACKTGYRDIIKIINRINNYERTIDEYLSLLESFNYKNTIFYAYWLSEPAYLLSRYKKKHPEALCVSRAHGYDCFKNRGYNPFRREIAENMDAVYAISEEGMHDLKNNLIPCSRTGKSAKIEVSHLGIPYPKQFTPLPRIKEEPFRIVTCSNLVKIKRLDILIDALAEIPKRTREIEWIHIGSGVLKHELENYAERKLSDLMPKIQWKFAGHMPNNEIHSYYADNHIDLFVNCSDAEGISVSVMEAMSYGIICICRDVGGMHELIDDGINGILLPAQADVCCLAKSIQFQIESEFNQAMSDNARLKIRKEFSTDNYELFVEELKRLFREKSSVKQTPEDN